MATTLLQKWLAGTATAEEIAMIEAWAAADPANKAALDKLQETAQTLSPGAAMEWEELEIMQPPPVKSSPPITRWIASNWHLLVPFAVVIIAAGSLFNNRQKIPEFTSFSISYESRDNILQEKLSNGINATLSAGSKLKYKKPSTSKYAPTITLEGDAVFNTAAVTEHFIIDAGPFELYSNKASFYFSNNISTGNMELHVLSGQVWLIGIGRTIHLDEGRSLLFNQAQQVLDTMYSGNPNNWGFASKVLSFKKTSLEEILPVLEKTYAIKFDLPRTKDLNCRITAKFDHSSLEQVLQEVINKNGLKYELTTGNKLVRLSGSRCQ